MEPTQHSSNNAVLGKPSNMTDEECSELHITRHRELDGYSALSSYWRPSAEELAALNDGGTVMLTVLSQTMPPVMVRVALKEE